MELELFSVGINKKAEIDVIINSDVLRTYGKSPEYINKKFDKQKLHDCIQELLDVLKGEK